MSFLKMFFGDPISAVINLIIIGVLVYVIVMISGIKKDIRKNSRQLSSVYSTQNVQRKMEQDATMSVVSSTSINPKEINAVRMEYDRICARYNTLSQIIPIFPSLGILGTVTGLMYQVQAEGIQEMTSSIAMALSSTFLALLFTVGLKYYMAVSVSKELSDIEVKYRDYERNRQDLVDKVKIANE